MIVQGRPVADGCRTDQGHGDLILMDWSDAWNRARQSIKASTEGDNPSIATQVVESFPQIRILETYLRGKFSGSLCGKDALSFSGD
jgi:hypothetical protein